MSNPTAYSSYSSFEIPLTTKHEQGCADLLFRKRPGLGKAFCNHFGVKYDLHGDDKAIFFGDEEKERRAREGFRLLVEGYSARLETNSGLQLESHFNKNVIGDVAREVHNAVIREKEASSVTTQFAAAAEQDNGPDRKTHHGYTPRNEEQTQAFDVVYNNEFTIVEGKAGSGKTRLAVAAGLDMLQKGKVQRLVLCRPAKPSGKAGEAFLPGNELDKLLPYMRPLYAELHELLGGGDAPANITKGKRMLEQMINGGRVEIAPLETIRGRSIKHAFWIIDEAQNATTEQMRSIVTRPGTGTIVVLTGDIEQCDLPEIDGKKDNGLQFMMEKIEAAGPVEGIGLIRLKKCERSPLVQKINDILDGKYRKASPVPALKPV